ncbi:hypothetical protein ACA910_009892 [Epithemia clementina (nom. ined.)]
MSFPGRGNDQNHPSQASNSKSIEVVTRSNNDNDNNTSSGIRLVDTTASASPGLTNSPATAQFQGGTPTDSSTGLPLDWTQLGGGGGGGANAVVAPPIRYPLDVVPELDVTDGEFVLVGTAGQKITHLGPDFSKLLVQACDSQPNSNDAVLRKLILRSHVIVKMEGLEELNHLELLELYDNQVQALVLTPNFSNTLIVLDMSYNAIRDMSPVQVCPHLREIYLANNKLKSISGLSGLKELRKLDLGANRIRVMPPEELSGLIQLEELWLGKNKIERIQGLSTLTKLRRLDLQSNRLGNSVNQSDNELDEEGGQFASISATLEELYLAHNGIERIGEWLLGNSTAASTRSFSELIVLDMSRNQLTEVNMLGSTTLFPVLEELWLAGNKVAEWAAVEQLSTLKTLETLYLEYNPIQTNDPLYRKSLAQLIPQLKQIDATLISAVASNALFGTSGLVIGAAGTRSALAPPQPVESAEDRMRRFQEMAIQRAKQEQQQASSNTKDSNGNADDSDDSENNGR